MWEPTISVKMTEVRMTRRDFLKRVAVTVADKLAGPVLRLAEGAAATAALSGCEGRNRANFEELVEGDFLPPEFEYNGQRVVLEFATSSADEEIADLRPSLWVRNDGPTSFSSREAVNINRIMGEIVGKRFVRVRVNPNYPGAYSVSTPDLSAEWGKSMEIDEGEEYDAIEIITLHAWSEGVDEPPFEVNAVALNQSYRKKVEEGRKVSFNDRAEATEALIRKDLANQVIVGRGWVIGKLEEEITDNDEKIVVFKVYGFIQDKRMMTVVSQ